MSIRQVLAGVADSFKSSVTFLSDLCNDVAGTLLSAHTPDVGSTWEKLGFNSNLAASSSDTQITASGDKLGGSVTSLAAVYRNAAVPPSADYEVSAMVNIDDIAAATAAVCARLTPTGTSLAAVDGYMVRAIGTTGAEKFELVKMLGGTGFVLDTLNEAMDLASEHTLKLRMTTAAKAGFWDGVQKVSSADNDVTQVGRAGIGSPRTGAGRTVDTILGVTV